MCGNEGQCCIAPGTGSAGTATANNFSLHMTLACREDAPLHKFQNLLAASSKIVMHDSFQSTTFLCQVFVLWPHILLVQLSGVMYDSLHTSSSCSPRLERDFCFGQYFFDFLLGPASTAFGPCTASCIKPLIWQSPAL